MSAGQEMDSSARVVAVAPGSPADSAGVSVGDELLAIDGEPLRDVIKYQLLTDEPRVDLELRTDGFERVVSIRKQGGEPLGLELESAVFDRVQTCDNHCPFCFIYQLPKGMRRSLYLKDDDFRLSFLYGNFTTLTRFTEADLERVVEERLGPLYVSIHATDPEVRAAMLRNRRGATSLRWLRLLLDHGVEVHGQVVVCPGINDGEILDDTMLGVLDRFPEISTVGVVPVGVSDHSNEPDIRPLTPDEATRTVETIEAWQERFRSAQGRRVVFASDELYLLAGRRFPDLDSYEGLPQHENGIGMARALEHDVRARLAGEDVEGHAPEEGFFAWVDRARPDGYRAPGGEQPVRIGPGRDAPVGIITGEYGARVLAPLLDDLSHHAGVPVRTVPVSNRFFGGNIAVTGLLSAADVAATLAAEPAGDRYLLPDVVLSRNRFLDEGEVLDLPHPVEVVRTDGASLVDALAR